MLVAVVEHWLCLSRTLMGMSHVDNCLLNRPSDPPHTARGFTIVELLIVIAIIAVLASLALLVGRSAVEGGKRTQTTDTIRVLDTALATQMHVLDGQVPATVTFRPNGGTQDYKFAIADAASATGSNSNEVVNSLGLWMVTAQSDPAVRKILDQINPKLVQTISNPAPWGGPTTAATAVPAIATILDGWGRPIRFVHPYFDGIYDTAKPLSARYLDPGVTAAVQRPITEIRRRAVVTTNPYVGAPNAATPPPDADGGKCVGERGYFYSMGADGRVGVLRRPTAPAEYIDWNEDNVYTTRPTGLPQLND